jgi:hypothetical protein
MVLYGKWYFLIFLCMGGNVYANGTSHVEYMDEVVVDANEETAFLDKLLVNKHNFCLQANVLFVGSVIGAFIGSIVSPLIQNTDAAVLGSVLCGSIGVPLFLGTVGSIRQCMKK